MSKVLVVADNEKVTAELVAAAGEAVVVESKSAKAIAEYATSNGFAAVFVVASMDGKELAGRIAVALNSGIITDAIAVDSDFVTTQSIFGGSYTVKAKVNQGIPVITLRPGSVEPAASVPAAIKLEGDDNSLVTIKNVKPKVKGARPELTEAKIVVSGGSATPTDSGSTGASAGTAPSVKVVDGLDLERLFGQAREDYIKARYDLAYQGFKTVYERDVGGSYKEQALYWMAECMWKSDRQDDALELYQRVLNEFPNGDKMCSARFKMGLIYNDKQDNLRRNNAWSQLIDACPQSNEANRARDMMHP